MTWKLWLAASVFGGIGILVAAAVIKGALTKNPFKPTPRTQADSDKEREMLRKTITQIHP